MLSSDHNNLVIELTKIEFNTSHFISTKVRQNNIESCSLTSTISTTATQVSPMAWWNDYFKLFSRQRIALKYQGHMPE